MKYIIEIDAEFGSDWQRELFESTTGLAIVATANFRKSAHKKNKIKVQCIGFSKKAISEILRHAGGVEVSI